jgi:radical SAM protein (TIGR01212 family)
MSDSLPFRTMRPWLLETYGLPLHRVALDAGSSCPNRDGTKGFGGCIYCDVEGSGTGALRSGQDLAVQLAEGLARVRRRGGGVIAYFQSYTNTYVERGRLEEMLACVEPHLSARGGPVHVVSIATRPDTLDSESLQRLAVLARTVPVWVELGLEAADDSVLRDINRLHTVGEFEDAAARVRAAGLLAVGHAILGLPGDGRAGARRTAEVLAASRVEGVKVHHLMVLRRTQLEARWRAGRVRTLEPEEYLEWLADFAERLRPDQVLHRLCGDAPADKLIAPLWTLHKNEIRARLAEILRRRGTAQGSCWSALSCADRGSDRSLGTG